MKVIYRLSAFLVFIGMILTIGAAGSSDLGMEIKTLTPYIIVGTTCLIIGAIGLNSVEEG